MTGTHEPINTAHGRRCYKLPLILQQRPATELSEPVVRGLNVRKALWVGSNAAAQPDGLPGLPKRLQRAINQG